MFIRKTTHTNNKNGQKYHTYKLVESVRTARGPRQRTVLNIGNTFSLPPEKWKELANRIEVILCGQLTLFPAPEEIEQLAKHYAEKIIRRHGQRSPIPAEDENKPDLQTVDVNSLENEQIRSVGGESVVLATIKKLALDRLLETLDFSPPNIEATIGVITARLLAPASERATHLWLQNNTSLDDLMGTSFASLSQDRVYKVSDMLLGNKDTIESHLQNREQHLFNLEEKILLYDLTNTFFEGSGKYNQKAHFGVSKEKRTDCPLVTLALLMDSDGFPKKSRFLEGNVSEPGTLKKMLPTICTATKKLIVVTDAGIGTRENVQWMNENEYHYIVVSRKRKLEIPDDIEMVTLREDDRRVIRAAVRINTNGEMEVYCHSTAKEIKERGIKNRFERRFEDNLAKTRDALHKKSGTKKYDKVLEKIGRLKEKYRRVARRYEIRVEKDDQSGNISDITWIMKQIDDIDGYYVLRSNLNNSNEKEIFDIFNQLLDVEDAFRSMKSELGLRPVHHQIEFRCDGHLFITLLAYHVLHSIRMKLKNSGMTHSWSTIRDRLATHHRVTTSMRRSDGKMIYIRKTAKPEECHTKIYDALGLPHRPGRISKTIL
ncbi:MAG: IS1634 family transposase [Desulfobacteraceae bacterium]|nr:MAG: IS1634 family transposase [Desulfobacteraceae bacterium]